MAERRGCCNKPNCFCYICGKFTTKSQRKSITTLVKNAYHAYFGMKLGDQDKKWAPHVICGSCYQHLTQWLKGKSSMPFAIPMVWREPMDHSTDCYFCMTKVAGYSARNKDKIVYPDIPSAIKPVKHDTNLPVPDPPQNFNSSETDSSTASTHSDSRDQAYDTDDGKPHLIVQSELNDLIRDLNLSKDKAELLASRLKQWNLLSRDTSVTVYRKRSTNLAAFYNTNENYCFCNNIVGLMQELGVEHNRDEWRLFIDSSMSSLKAILLHNGNTYPSVPLFHAVNMKETYESMKQILEAVSYEEHKWSICADFKVIGLLTGMQSGFTKYCCFLCLWDSRATVEHYVKQQWPARTEYEPGKMSVKQTPLVNPEAIFLPPLHIKLGLMKNFVQALNKDGEGFGHLKQMFPKITEAKLKEGIFVGPQIRKVMQDVIFPTKLTDLERAAWLSFKDLCAGFLGNTKSADYKDLVNKFLNNYHAIGARMSLKIHFLHSHIDFFPENLGAVSDEHGERFHQEIAIMEQRYKGKYSSSMMGDFCWSLQRDSNVSYNRRPRSTRHFQSTSSS